MMKYTTIAGLLIAGLVIAALPGSFKAVAGTGTPDSLAALADGGHRSEANRARNIYRHPVETLTFFGLKPDMTVVEIWPGGGWYAEIIAPYVEDRGQYYAAGFDQNITKGFYPRLVRTLAEKFSASPDLYGNAITTELAPPAKTDIAPAGSADMVLTFRNMHNWLAAGTTKDVLAAVYRALKPGGIFGVVDHRANPDEPEDPKAATGYVNQAMAIRLIEAAGFKLVDRSEMNANPKDNRDHPKGVWTLPPTYRLGDKDHAKYAAIGESDRFTLKFIKPVP